MGGAAYFLLILNWILTGFFAGGYYPVVGIILSMLSIAFCLCDKGSGMGRFIIGSQIKKWKPEDIIENKERYSVLMSIAFLTLAMKIGAAIAAVIEFSAAVLIALAVLIASGYLFEGSNSGMTIGGAWAIGKLVVKLYIFLNSLVDKMAGVLVKIEFSVLGVESHDNDE